MTGFKFLCSTKLSRLSRSRRQSRQVRICCSPSALNMELRLVSLPERFKNPLSFWKLKAGSVNFSEK